MSRHFNQVNQPLHKYVDVIDVIDFITGQQSRFAPSDLQLCQSSQSSHKKPFPRARTREAAGFAGVYRRGKKVHYGEHIKVAESLLEKASEGPDSYWETPDQLIAMAQVHATLALAAKP